MTQATLLVSLEDSSNFPPNGSYDCPALAPKQCIPKEGLCFSADIMKFIFLKGHEDVCKLI